MTEEQYRKAETLKHQEGCLDELFRDILENSNTNSLADKHRDQIIDVLKAAKEEIRTEFENL